VLVGAARGVGIAATTRKGKRWSQRVTETSDALELEKSVFAKDDPSSIARSLKRSAERSKQRKSNPYRSAMSMLTFYINRAGKTLSQSATHEPRVGQGRTAPPLWEIATPPGEGLVGAN